MHVPSIKSRPVYTTLEPRPGALHIVVTDAAGARAVLALASRAPTAFFDSVYIIHVDSLSSPDGGAEGLLALQPCSYEWSATVEGAIARLNEMLETAAMGTQLYLAGTEGLIGQATRAALMACMEPESIQAEHQGSDARRVQCVHCKGVTEDVRTQPAICSRCGLTLFVRDHYSRRIAAFQGVCIDAEEPGVVPPPQELFQ